MDRRGKTVTWAFLAAALALVASLSSAGRSAIGHDASAVTTPLFERRLQEIAVQFDQAAGAPGHGRTAAQRRQMAPAQQNAALFISVGVSYCVGSGCVSSGCVGSGCANSVCAGSGCTASACVGSACLGQECNRPASPDTVAMAGGRAYCPLDGDDAVAEVRITGLGATETTAGNETRFAAARAEVAGFRVYREGTDQVLVAHGSVAGDRLVRVVDRRTGPGEANYTVELIDTLGRITRAVLAASVSQTAALQGPSRPAL